MADPHRTAAVGKSLSSASIFYLVTLGPISTNFQSNLKILSLSLSRSPQRGHKMSGQPENGGKKEGRESIQRAICLLVNALLKDPPTPGERMRREEGNSKGRRRKRRREHCFPSILGFHYIHRDLHSS